MMKQLNGIAGGRRRKELSCTFSNAHDTWSAHLGDQGKYSANKMVVIIVMIIFGELFKTSKHLTFNGTKHIRSTDKGRGNNLTAGEA